MTRIRRVGVISVANVAAAITFVITAFFVVLFALIVLPMRGNLPSQFGVPAVTGGLAILIIAPFIYAAFGWVSGAISALVYNLVASFTGGVQLDLEHRAPTAAWTPGGPMPPTAAPPADV